MDVQADQTGAKPDHATIVFERPGGSDQTSVLTRPRQTSYDDTDQLPVVPRQRHRASAGTRALRVAIAVLAAAIILAGAALGLVKAGVIHTGSNPPAKKAVVAPTPTTIPTNTPFLTQTATGNLSTTYSIPISVYSVTVATSTERSWVSISAAGQKPAYEGVLEAGQSKNQVLLGGSTIEVGAGGTTITVTSGKHSQVLKPPAAPYTYIITPQS